MNDDRFEPLTAEQESARRALAGLSSPPADPEFRSRLKHAFASGELASAAGAGPEPHRVAPPAPAWWSWPVLRWAAVPAALAALAIAMVTGDRGPAWEVVSATGTGIAIVGDRPIPINHIDDLKRYVRAGVRVRVPENSTLEIASHGHLAFHIAPGTDLTLPRPPGRWFSRSASGTIRSGVVRITSGSEFAGARLTMITPEAEVLVTGTTLAVIREPQGTCVCVLEGSVRMGPLDGEMATVPRGERRFIFNDGRPPETAEMRGTEVGPLGEFKEKCHGLMGP